MTTQSLHCLDYDTLRASDSTHLWVHYLAEAVRLGVAADQVIIGICHSNGTLQELASVLAPGEEQCLHATDLFVHIGEPAAAELRQSDDLAQTKSEVQQQVLPCPMLLIREALPGGSEVVLVAARKPGRDAFSAGHTQLAQALARVLCARPTFDELPLLLHVRLLTQIAQVGGSNPDLNFTLRFALRELARYCPGCWASVWLHESREGPSLQLTAYSDPPWKTGRCTALLHTNKASSSSVQLPTTTCLLVRETPLVTALEKRQIVYWERLAEQSWDVLRQWAALGFHAAAAIPLFVGQEKVGVLLLLSKRSVGFTRDELHLAATIAELLGPIIACHRLTGQLSQAYEQLQKAQQQLVNAEKMRALGELASGMAHDFNNALCGTLGFIELALREPQLPAAVEELLRMARTCALDAAATVRRVQDFARWERGLQNAEIVLVNDLVRQVVELTRPRWHNAARAGSRIIDVQLDLQSQAHVMANPSELREVLTNIILNAVDAMPQGGKITITTQDEENYVAVHVRDTGMGMTPEVQQRVFEPFFTTKKERGTGLGLSISYAIIKRHGGDISVESELGRGSTFTIRLPVVRQDPTPVPSNGSALACPKHRASLRILVVDDEPHVVSFLRQSLLHLGHQPQTFQDPEQALDDLRRNCYDLVISDLSMPKVDGLELASACAQIAPQVPVVLLTGWGEQLRQGDSLPAAVRYVLNKPITIQQLEQVLHHFASDHGS
ncbi:MAG: ATP-binding protein [Gemmatales bacterium]|nr:ATP-binding protein [Gemmatales bacterium]